MIPPSSKPPSKTLLIWTSVIVDVRTRFAGVIVSAAVGLFLLTGCGALDADEKKFFYDSWNGRDLVPPMYGEQGRQVR